jgi:hypothetical protein
VFRRDDNPSSGIPGAAPSGLGGLPGSTGTVSLGKPATPGVPSTSGPAGPPREWELGPLSALAFLVVALAAGTFGFVSDWHHRQSTAPASTDGSTSVKTTSTDSFTNAPRLSKAIAAVEAAAPGAKLSSLSVLPGEVDASLIDADGLEVDVTVDSSLHASVDETGDGLTGPAVALSRVPTASPSRILSAAQQKFGLQPNDLMTFDLNASSVPGKVGSWHLQYTQPSTGNSIDAALDGTNVRKIDQ